MTKLLTKADLTKLLKNGQNPDKDHKPVVKFFTPDANATWLLSELDADGDRAFGLCDTGHGSPELGYVSLNEISKIRGRFRLPVERDRWFKADKPMSAYADIARAKQRIVT